MMKPKWLWLLVGLWLGPPLAAGPVISEFMASNSGVAWPGQTPFLDEDGDSADWIEIHNPAAEPVDLSGWYLTDDADDLTRWRFPGETSLGAGEYRVVFASGKDRRSGELHTNFKLSAAGEYLALIGPDGGMVAHAYAPRFPKQLTDVSYGLIAGEPAGRYFTVPTPGGPNVSTPLDLVAAPLFSHAHGFYDEPFSLVLVCETPGAAIRYTTDGSAPTATTGQLYDAPIVIDTTTCVRAAAFRSGYRASAVQTHTYVFLDRVVQQPSAPPGFPATWGQTNADYEMDPEIADDPAYGPALRAALESLPTMSLVMDVNDLFGANGIYENYGASGPEWERPASVELIFADGTTGFQADCGAEIYGGVGRIVSKKSLQLSFKSRYGPARLRYPLFGAEAADEFDQLILRANFNDGYAWGGARAQYIRDEYVRRLQLALGQPAPRGRFVHLYINGLYWGLYNPTERPEASFAATYFGGDKDHWDALNSGRPTGDSTTETWDAMLDLLRQGVRTNEAYQRVQGNDPDGTPNPTYPAYLDVQNYIDYLIVNFFVGNADWPRQNWYAALNHVDPSGWKFFTWDAEWTVGLNSGLTLDQTGLDEGVCEPYRWLRENVEFRLAFADRVQKACFHGGPLDVDPNQPQQSLPAMLYADLADTIELAMLGESARWGDVVSAMPYTLAHWLAERDRVLDEYMPQRAAIVLSQFVDADLYPSLAAPTFRIDGVPQHGGHVPRGALLTMDAGAGTVYYTTDGSDPRLPVSGSGGGAIVTLVSEEAPKSVRVPSGPHNGWTSIDFDDSTWLVGLGGIGFEAGAGNYDAYFDTDVLLPMFGQNASCFVRIPFVAESTSSSKLLLKVRYDDGFVAYLNGVEIARRNFVGAPAWNSTASNANPDSAATILQTLDVTEYVSLLAPGANVLALHAMNQSAGDADFLIAAELIAEYDETGDVSPSAEAFTGPLPLAGSVRIKARALTGRWSALSDATFIGPE